MRVILLTDVKGQGSKGQVIEVKDGFARNYLIPRGLAKPATRQAEAEAEAERRRQAAKAAQERQAAAALAEALNGQTVIIRARAGESGRLFGAVTSQDVAAVLKERGYTIDRRQINLDPVHLLGQYEARVHLYGGIEARLAVRVLPEE
ncbi:MAG: 50S ribosomal protein L9 [Firmicutes bacterium]|nr:50S ribosomal protein L9 [Bacillota bacterium]